MENTSLTPADVEVWLNDNVDWLRDYLQRHQSILGDHSTPQSRHTVSTQSRAESTPSSWHSRTHTFAVDEAPVTSTTSRITSSTHHHLQVRDDVTVAELTSPRCVNVPIDNGDGAERRPSAVSTQYDSKRHLRRHFAKSRMRVTDNQFSNKTSASFDWFVPHTHTHTHTRARASI